MLSHWTSATSTLNPGDLNLNLGEAKLQAFNAVPFDQIRGCVGTPTSNCLTGTFGGEQASAASFFNSEPAANPCTTSLVPPLSASWSTVFGVSLGGVSCLTGSFFNHPDCGGGGGTNLIRWGTHFDEDPTCASSNEGVGWGTDLYSAGLAGYCARFTGGCSPRNTWLWVGARSLPGSCAEARAKGASADGLYTIDPNGGGAADAVKVFCDMTTQGGGWTAITANGDISVDETTAANDCYPLITNVPGQECGNPSNLLEDFVLKGSQQAYLSWRYLLGLAYGSAGYSDKLAYFAIDFGSARNTAEERTGGTPFVPAGLTTTNGQIACTGFGAGLAHCCKAGTYNNNASYVANNKGTVFGHANVTTMNSTSRGSFGFTDVYDWSGAAGQSSPKGIDDYQDGWSCGDSWGPKQVRGQRMVVLVK